MSSKSTGKPDAAIIAAWIGAAGAVLAALIGGAFLIYSGHSSGGGAAGPQGSSSGTPSATAKPSASGAPSASGSSPAGKTWTETTFSTTKTFGDFVNAGDPLGAPLQERQSVQVSCRVKGFAVQDGDRWWYRLSQSPWNGRYYASSDDFYNTPTPTGNPINGVEYDKRVPVCRG